MHTQSTYRMTTLLAILLLICFGIEAFPSNQQQVDTIAAKDVNRIVKMHMDLIIIDCRDSNQYAHSHIPGAIGMDVRRPNGVSHYLDTLNRNVPYLIYCRTNIRIQSLLRQMLEKDFRQIYVMTDGWLKWESLNVTHSNKSDKTEQ